MKTKTHLRVKYYLNYFKTNLLISRVLFLGRCIGVAKKIKQLLPFLVFKLGAIMTLLGFLTLFSLKTLGLLGLLLLINTGSIVAKITAALAHKHDNKKQNIHLHIHNNKDG